MGVPDSVEPEDFDYEADPPEIDPGDVDWQLHANEALRRIAFWEGRQAEDDHTFQRELARLTVWHEKRSQVTNQRIGWHKLSLIGLHKALLEDDPKRKTIVLPYGTLKARVSKTPRFSITDKDAFLQWCETNTLVDELCIVERRPSLDKIKDFPAFVHDELTAGADPHPVRDNLTAELVPGVSVWLASPTFSQDTGGDL